MSIWDNGSGNLVPPGTPEVKIRLQRARSGAESWIVLADGQEVERCASYRAAHIWAQNTYRLTSTPMSEVFQDYVRALETEQPPEPTADGNPYRKPQP